MIINKFLRYSLFLIVAILPHKELYPSGKNKVYYDIFSRDIIKTIHFDIYYPHGMNVLAVKTAKIAEQAYINVVNTLNRKSEFVISIIVDPEYDNINYKKYISENKSEIIYLTYFGNDIQFKNQLIKKIKYAFRRGRRVSNRGRRIFVRKRRYVTSPSVENTSPPSEQCLVKVSPDGKKIYIMDGEKGSIKEIISLPFRHISKPSISNNLITFTGSSNNSSDIYIYNIKLKSIIRVANDNLLNKEKYVYADEYFKIADSILTDYTPSLFYDSTIFGLSGKNNDKFSSYVKMSLRDILYHHHLYFTADYIRYEKNSDVNFLFLYRYSKHKFDYTAEVFKYKNIHLGLEDKNFYYFIHDNNHDINYMNYYGISNFIKYSIDNNFAIEFKNIISRYSNNSVENIFGNDTFYNIKSFSMAIEYDNLKYSKSIPRDGLKGRFILEHSSYFIKNNFNYFDLAFDFEKYFYFFDRYIFAMNGTSGKIFSGEENNFNYSIGEFSDFEEYNSYRGFGENFFHFYTEMRYIFIKNMRINWPLYSSSGRIDGIMFHNISSIWEDEYFHFKDNDSILKTNFGLGVRFTIYPLLILKLDYAWAYNNKTIENSFFLFGIECRY